MNKRVTRTDTEDPYAAAGIPAVLLSGTGYIEAQEKRGQDELVVSDSLPADTGGTDSVFLSLGFEFGEPYVDDPLFRPATIPDEWRLKSSDHVMYSYLVDENGDRRVEVFYKAAYYDRRAFMRVIPAKFKDEER